MIFIINSLSVFYLTVLVVVGSSRVDSCCQGAVRLVNGSGLIPHEGRVEVCNSGHWKTVCDDNWHTCDAAVICAQLGFSREGSTAFKNAAFGQGSGLILEDIDCQGTERLLIDCTLRDSNDIYRECFHYEDAGIRCVPIANNCIEGDIKLISSSGVVNEGRIEICINGVWGTICPNNGSVFYSSIVCKQLGFSEKGARPTVVHSGLMPTYISDISCTGNEEKLIDCAHRKGTFTCSGCFSAGVQCNYDIAPAPLSFEVAIDYNNYANISWLPPIFVRRHGTLMGYSLNCSGTAVEGRVIAIETQNTTEEVQMLSHETYQCCVSAINEAGIGYPSCTLVATYYHHKAPTAAPTNISWIALSNSSVLLFWHPPPLEHQNGYIQEYSVKLHMNDTFDVLGARSINYTTMTQFITIEHLSPNTDYFCSVAAYFTSLGPYSSPVTVRLQVDTNDDWDCQYYHTFTTQDSNETATHTTVMSGSGNVEAAVLDLKTDSEAIVEEFALTYTLAALSGALVLIVIGMLVVFAASYYCYRSHKTEESKENEGDDIYETVDESKDKLRKNSIVSRLSLSERKQELRLSFVAKSPIQANTQQEGANSNSSFPNKSENGTYQPLIPPRGERKEKNYQCLTPIEDRVDTFAQIKDDPNGESLNDPDRKFKENYQTLVHKEPKESKYQCLSPVAERFESLAQLESDASESLNDPEESFKNNYQTLVHKEPKENKYQCLSPIQEYVKFVGQMEGEGGADYKAELKVESRNTYQSLMKDDIERSSEDYQSLAEFTQQQNEPFPEH